MNYLHVANILIVNELYLSEFGKSPQILSFADNYCVMRRADGAIVTTW